MSSTLTMMDFFPRRCLNDPPGGPGPLTCQAICATHNKVNIFVRRTNLHDLAPNSFGSRNGCLSFWKLRPPNLIRCLFAARTGFQKSVLLQALSRNSDQVCRSGGKTHPDSGSLDRKPSRQVGII